MTAYLRHLGLEYRPGPEQTPCEDCGGSGVVIAGLNEREVDCPECSGRGWVEAGYAQGRD